MPKKQSGLGRDLFSLYDDNLAEATTKGVGTTVRTSDIEPRSNQPRKEFAHESLEQLADSIATYGVLQPILVRENPACAGTYEIIAGERRWRAAKMAGLSEIPVVILNGDDLHAAQVSIIENVQREDLNPVEEAFAYQSLIDQFNLSQELVSKQVGKSRSAITNMLRLLDLPEEVIQLLRDNKISAGHARALLGLNSKDKIVPLANTIVAKNMSVREVEKTVKLYNNVSVMKDIGEEESELNQRKVYMRDLERRVVSSLGRKVKILQTPKKKVIELSYSDDQDLEALLTSICGKQIFDET